MPQRKVILATGETYHIFNRSIRGSLIFTYKREIKNFLQATKYYLQPTPPVKFSIYKQQQDKYKIDLTNKLVNLIAFCLMPDHFHFILTQVKTNGIKSFIQRLTNSYSHYFNLKHHQRGPVFESKFKAVRVGSQEQLVHLSRYIHLNPVTGYLVEDPLDYIYSSYKVYLNQEKSDYIDPSDIMVDFSSPKDYMKFVLNQKEYQRELKNLKHLLLE